jgi:hypothetical protein
MNKSINLLLVIICLALNACGTQEVWKEWESEGTPSDTRLKPSEVKAALCGTPAWKLTFKAHDYYFQFAADGSVISNSDATVLIGPDNTTYRINSQGDAIVALTIDGGGNLSTLPESDREDTFLISAVSATSITATAQKSGATTTFVPVTLTVISEQTAAKAALTSMKTKGFFNGVVRSSEGEYAPFVAHYAISLSEQVIRFSSISNRVLSHLVSPITYDNGTFTFENAITVGGQSVTALVYSDNGDGAATLTGGSSLYITSSTDIVTFFRTSPGNGGYTTHILSKANNKGDAKALLFDELGWDQINDLELSDRDKRPLVFTPRGSDYWYVFFDSQTSAGDLLIKGDELDRIYFTRQAGYMPYGGNAENISQTEANLPNLFAAWFHPDGLYIVREIIGSKSYFYFLSPTTDNWFRYDR